MELVLQVMWKKQQEDPLKPKPGAIWVGKENTSFSLNIESKKVLSDVPYSSMSKHCIDLIGASSISTVRALSSTNPLVKLLFKMISF